MGSSGHLNRCEQTRSSMPCFLCLMKTRVGTSMTTSGALPIVPKSTRQTLTFISPMSCTVSLSASKLSHCVSFQPHAARLVTNTLVNVPTAINGYVFESGPLLGFCTNEIATWHVSSIGAQDFIQTATVYGHKFELNGRTEDFLSLYPMTGETITMSMENIGW